MDIFADVEEERSIATPMSPHQIVVHIYVRRLVGVLEPKICWLCSTKIYGGFEAELISCIV